MEPLTMTALRELLSAGVGLLEVRDVGDVTLARNIALSRALVRLQQDERFDMCLMIDDDMVFNARQAYELVNSARQSGDACSGAYVLSNFRVAARHMKDGFWTTGLGFLAIPKAKLEKLAQESKKFKPARELDELVWEFTRSGAAPFEGQKPDEPDLFESEDTCLTRRLGGVRLLPIALGHVKRNVLWADHNKLPAFLQARGEPPK